MVEWCSALECGKGMGKSVCSEDGPASQGDVSFEMSNQMPGLGVHTVAFLIAPGACARVAGRCADLLGLRAAEVVVVGQGRGDRGVLQPKRELRLDLGGELVVPRRRVGSARLVEVNNCLVAAARRGAVDDLAGVLPAGIAGLIGGDEEVGPAVETDDGRGGQAVVTGRGDVFAVAVFVLGGAGGVAGVDTAVGKVFGVLADVARVALDHVKDFSVDGGGDGGCCNQCRGKGCEPGEMGGPHLESFCAVPYVLKRETSWYQ